MVKFVPCFFFHSKLFKTLLVIHFLYSKNKKKSMRREKPVRALMINRDIFLSGLTVPDYVYMEIYSPFGRADNSARAGIQPGLKHL